MPTVSIRKINVSIRSGSALKKKEKRGSDEEMKWKQKKENKGLVPFLSFIVNLFSETTVV